MNEALEDTLTKFKLEYPCSAKVIIKTADDKQIVCLCSIQAGDPKITNGSFRALVKTKK